MTKLSLAGIGMTSQRTRDRLVQRLVEEGSQRFSSAITVTCGESLPKPETGAWSPVNPPGYVQPESRSGVFRSGQKWMAVQRPPQEDEPERLSRADLEPLFGELPLQMFAEDREGAATLQSELWRAFLVAMLLLLLGEAVIILPERKLSSETVEVT